MKTQLELTSPQLVVTKYRMAIKTELSPSRHPSVCYLHLLLCLLLTDGEASSKEVPQSPQP